MGSNAWLVTCRASTASWSLNFNGGEGAARVSYKDVFLQAEQEYSRYDFEAANTDKLFSDFNSAEAECGRLLEFGRRRR